MSDNNKNDFYFYFRNKLIDKLISALSRHHRFYIFTFTSTLIYKNMNNLSTKKRWNAPTWKGHFDSEDQTWLFFEKKSTSSLALQSNWGKPFWETSTVKRVLFRDIPFLQWTFFPSTVNPRAVTHKHIMLPTMMSKSQLEVSYRKFPGSLSSVYMKWNLRITYRVYVWKKIL